VPPGECAVHFVHCWLHAMAGKKPTFLGKSFGVLGV